MQVSVDEKEGCCSSSVEGHFEPRKHGPLEAELAKNQFCLASTWTSRRTLSFHDGSRDCKNVAALSNICAKICRSRPRWANMSFKAKDLTYNKQEPSFLRKLKEEHAGVRNNVQFARPRKDRLKAGDADEDEPTIVDESGERLGKEEWEEMLRKEKDGGGDRKAEAVVEEGKEQEDSKGVADREKQQIAEIGAGKKRKAVKVVGEEDKGKEPATKMKGTEDRKSDAKDASKAPKKKAKKIKLSFDEPDEG